MSSTTARGAPYPVAADANDYPGYMHSLATWVNDRPGIATLTTTARNALAGADLWAGRVIWNTTTSRLEYYDGTSWGPIPSPGRILTDVVSTTGSTTTTSSGDVDVDASLQVTFTAPASGKVWVELQGPGTIELDTSTSTALIWSVRNGSTTLASTLVAQSSSAPGFSQLLSARLHVTGLTAGSSYTLKWAHHLSSVGGTGIVGLGTGTGSPSSMRVVEA